MMMKQGVSTLNPYAASYVPLSKREPADKIEVPGGGTTQSGNQNAWHGRVQQQDKASFAGPKSQSAYGVSGSSSQKLDVTEEAEMDLDYLRMEFPGISDESLTGVYMANKGDLEATEDMLNQLVYDSLESSENLPDTLDIGDISECGSSAECSSKQKNVVGAIASQSDSSASQSISASRSNQ